MTNERLRAAIPAAGYDYIRFAATLGVDPKTVERWVSGRIPHRSHRMAAASKLGKSDGYLWPSTYNDAPSRSATEAEVVKIYPSRGAVPVELWVNLASQATSQITILAYAGSFLNDTLPGFVDALEARSRSGVRVRIILGDPECEAVSIRGREEGIDDLMAARCKLSIKYFEPLVDCGVELRTHDTTLYASLFRFDDVLLVNPHAYGAPASLSPVLHVANIRGGRLFDHYEASLNRVVDQSKSTKTQARVPA